MSVMVHPVKRNKPNVSLTAPQYLCLKMCLNPGRSKKWYLRALSVYMRGHERGGWGWQLFKTFSDLWSNSKKGPHDSSYTLTFEGYCKAWEAAHQIDAQEYIRPFIPEWCITEVCA